MKSGRLAVTWFLAFAFAMAMPASGSAQPYPSRPVTLIVPFGSGTAIDTIGRAISQELAVSLKQPVVVENQNGATGAIGTSFVARAKPDGYTLLINSSSGILAELRGESQTRLLRDFSPVASVGNAPYTLAVRKDFPASTMADVLALARARPGSLTYVSLSGGGPQFLGEGLRRLADINIVEIPYKNTTDAQLDVMSGRVDLWFVPAGNAAPLVNSGKIKVLAVLGKDRSPILEGVPTMAEAGIQSLDQVFSFYFFAPAGTPKEVLQTLSTTIEKAMASDNVKRALLSLGVAPRFETPQVASATLRDEYREWGTLLKAGTPRHP